MHKKALLFSFALFLGVAHVTYFVQEANDLMAFNSGINAPRSIAFIPHDIHTLSEFFASSLNSECALSHEQIIAYIESGKQYAVSLDQPTPQTLATNANHLNTIIALMWHLYALAIGKEQAHHEGTFIIEDTDHALHNFLVTYVKKVNPHQEKPVFVSSNKYGCSRYSSHFAHRQNTYTQYGIDIRFEDQTALPLLPTGKRHILFGQLDENYMFIKMEYTGIYYADGFISHSLGMVKEVAQKKMPALFGSIDHNHQRTENVPAAIAQQYAKIAKKHDLHPHLQRIKDLFVLAAEDQLLFQELIQEINTTYDHPQLRYGREVIVLEDDYR